MTDQPPQPGLTIEEMRRILSRMQGHVGPVGPVGPPGPVAGPGGYDPEAHTRAHELLLRILTPEQRQEYEEKHTITTYEGDRAYVLSYADLQVRVWENDKQIENWCAYIPNTPREDTLVAQLLALRTDPEGLRKSAVVTVYDEHGLMSHVEHPRRRMRTGEVPPRPWYEAGALRLASVARLLRRTGYVT